MARVSVVYPIFRNQQQVLRDLTTLQNQVSDSFELLVLDQRGEKKEDFKTRVGQLFPNVKWMEKQFKNIAEMMNFGFEQTSGELFVYMPPNIGLKPNLIQKYQEAFQSSPKPGMVFSDYEEVYPNGKIEEKKLRNYDGDITERGNYGYVKGYARKAAAAVGFYDEGFNRAEEYDFRLKLSEDFDLIRVPEILYDVFVSTEEAAEKTSVGASKLFYPGEGKYGGFSYLFYDKEEEQEIERAFYDYLKRIGAYLTHENEKVVYGPDETFSPMVSVIIPVYNRAKFIGKAIDSVLNGNYQDFDIIIVDNGSTDNTVEVVESYVKKDPRVRLIKNDKNIIGLSLNLAVNASTAKYISQLDSDDEYNPITLEAMVGHLERNPKCGLAISYYELIDEDSNVLEEFGIIKHLEYNRNNILRVDGAGAVRTWHRKVILEMGGFDVEHFGNYGEDYDLVLKVSEKYDVCRVQEVCYRYRRHADNTDVKREPEMKIYNKTLARKMAIQRRIELNKKLGFVK